VRIAWPVFVVTPQPTAGDLAHVFNGVEDVGVEHFVAAGAVEALDEGVLIRLPRLNEQQCNVVLLAPAGKVMPGQLGPVIAANCRRLAVDLPRLL
jgi:hypothetical protein